MPTVVRTLLKRDFDEVLAIEQLSFTVPWDQEKLINTIRSDHHATAIIVQLAHRVAGYCFYSVRLPRTEVLRLAVHPQDRRRGIGRMLVERLKGQLRPTGRHRLDVRVPQVNAPAQKFFRACGLVATGLRDKQTSCPKILFRYCLREREVSEGTEVLRSIMEGDCRVVTGW